MKNYGLLIKPKLMNRLNTLLKRKSKNIFKVSYCSVKEAANALSITSYANYLDDKMTVAVNKKCSELLR